MILELHVNISLARGPWFDGFLLLSGLNSLWLSRVWAH